MQANTLAWQNTEEVHVIINIIKNYYKTDFCIITPYDAQRGAISKALKVANLPWESVYNVDSFQGSLFKHALCALV